MVKTLFLALGLALSVSAKALTINDVVSNLNNTVLSNVDTQGVFNWVVGDTASYSLSMGFISGSMTMTIKSLTDTQLVITQDMDLGFMGKQSCEMAINPQTGKTISMVCNGQAQNAGDPTVEVIESKEDTVKVPAGTFTCLYIKAKSTQDGKETIVQQWANPKLVPVMGMVKAIAPSQLGDANIELTSFKKM